LIVQAIRRDFAALAIPDKVIGTIPVLNDVEAFLNLLSERLRMEISAEEYGFAYFPQFQKRLEDGMFETAARKPAEDCLCICGSKPKGSGVS
jgi:hypothetical protein